MNTTASARSPARLHKPSVVSLRTEPKAGTSYIDVRLDSRRALGWFELNETAPAYVSTGLLQEMALHSRRIQEGDYGLVRTRILSSLIPGVFSLGGDLGYFISAIENQDRARLLQYAVAAIEVIWSTLSGCGTCNLASVALVEGEAQGGGFEAALACQVIVAEESASFGFPETLFGLFPGMGAAHLIAARSDKAVAERLISRANRYPARFLKEIGIIDFVVPDGRGRCFLNKSSIEDSLADVYARRTESFQTIKYSTLLSSVEEWVDTAMRLSARNLRSMRYLLTAQRRATTAA
ncbi:MAG: crotonase/enoyl-CoA hydratase family protein [Gammaproteobacteria bacterium]